MFNEPSLIFALIFALHYHLRNQNIKSLPQTVCVANGAWECQCYIVSKLGEVGVEGGVEGGWVEEGGALKAKLVHYRKKRAFEHQARGRAEWTGGISGKDRWAVGILGRGQWVVSIESPIDTVYRTRRTDMFTLRQKWHTHLHNVFFFMYNIFAQKRWLTEVSSALLWLYSDIIKNIIISNTHCIRIWRSCMALPEPHTCTSHNKFIKKEQRSRMAYPDPEPHTPHYKFITE